MPNPIKYTTGTETLALKKGNFYIGTGDVGKGPSDTTGYYQGPSPSEGGYVIYMNREGAPGDLSYHSAVNDSELITFTNNLAGQSYTTVQECLIYYANQNNKVVLNRNYEGIITNGLIFNMDAGFTPSYPTSNTTWYDISGGNNGTLINGPTFSADGGGSVVFDGVDDKCFIGGYPELTPSQVTLSIWTYLTTFNGGGSGRIIAGMSDVQNWRYGYFIFTYPYLNQGPQINFGVSDNSADYQYYLVNLNQWYNLSLTFDGSIQKSYSNGVLIGTKIRSMSYRDTNRFQIGDGYNYNSPYAGKIGSVQVYNRALSATEILQNYNAQKGRFGL
jgi:hypothetical protein